MTDLAPSFSFTAAAGPHRIALAVAGAHLRGQPLHHELTALDAEFLGETRTSDAYRFFALTGTSPAKPGLVRGEPGSGAHIVVEVYALTPEAFGRFVAAIPPPLAIGTATLQSGEAVKGFVCEPCALAGALDITAFGGWHPWRSSL